MIYLYFMVRGAETSIDSGGMGDDRNCDEVVFVVSIVVEFQKL